MKIAAQVERYDIASACAGLGLPADTPKTGVIRGALAYLAGKNEKEIAIYANPSTGNNLTVKTRTVTAEIPDDLGTETLAEAKNKSQIIRMALLMASGYDREQAEAVATMKRGRPRKTRSTS